MENYREKFQQLLRELFQFDCADLDFGIYRIMNYKREVIERFIEKDLLDAVAAELGSGALAEQSAAAEELKRVREQVGATLGEATIDGDGNLAKEYFTTPLGRKYLDLQSRASESSARPALEAMVFNHLNTFFRRYYDNGDFMSRRRYSKQEKYAVPYNGEEVVLHWANKDQYYVKTGEYFKDYRFTSQGVTVHFRLQDAQVEQDNVKGDKRYFIPCPKETTYDAKGRELVIPFEYRPLTEQEEIAYGKKNQQDAILAEALEAIPQHLRGATSVRTSSAAPCGRQWASVGVSGRQHDRQRRAQGATLPDEALGALVAERRKTADGKSVSHLEHHLRQYTRRNTSDFFIHKDLQGFLKRELDFYLKNEVLNLDDLEVGGEARAEGWFQILRVMKSIGHNIIAFLAQIENFRKRLYEKKKFVTAAEYCVTLDRVPEELYPEIVKNKAQIGEWVRLFAIDEIKQSTIAPGYSKPLTVDFLKANPFLVLDTKFFGQDFKDRLLTSFENLDEESDGLLIHSENWQALNLLQERYTEQVKCIYIDPPYNTGKDEFLYKDSYQHSSWLTMMEERSRLTVSCMTGDAVMLCSIGDHELNRLLHLCEGVWGQNNQVAMFIWNTDGNIDNQSKIKQNHEYIAAYSPNAKGVRPPSVIDPNIDQNSKLFKEQIVNTIVKNGPGNPESEIVLPRGFPADFEEGDIEPGRATFPKFDEVVKVKNGRLTAPLAIRSGWSSRNLIDQFIQGGMKPIRDSKGVTTAFLLKNTGAPYVVKARPSNQGHVLTVLRNLGSTQSMAGQLAAMGFAFDYPKPIGLIQYLVSVFADNHSVVCDFFVGSGTTAHAVINLNREDGKRKYILVEMGDYFDTVMKPRIQKVIYSKDWKDGKPVSREGSSHLVKYLRLESYEDALNNIAFSDKGSQQALEFEDYVMGYMLDFETRDSETFLNVEQLASPFSYQLHLTEGQETKAKPVDLPETFNYLIGLRVETRRVVHDKDRRYLVYRGTVDHREVVAVWRETDGWDEKDHDRDRRFVAKQKLTEGADEVFVNGDSLIPGAKSLDPIFKRRMFAQQAVVDGFVA